MPDVELLDLRRGGHRADVVDRQVVSCIDGMAPRGALGGDVDDLGALGFLGRPGRSGVRIGVDLETDDEPVFDLGGGTFDVSLLSIDDGIFEVMATAG